MGEVRPTQCPGRGRRSAIQGLPSLTRIEAGAKELTPINPNELVQQAMSHRWFPRKRKAIVALLVMAILGSFVVRSASRRFRIWQVERLVDRGRFAEAEAAARATIEESPDSPRPRLLLARAVCRQGRCTEAEEILQRAVELGLDIKEARVEHLSILSAGSGD